MSKDTIRYYLNQHKEYGMLKLQIANQCAPVIKGIKPSNIITIDKNLWRHMMVLLKETKLKAAVMYKNNERIMILFYRPSALIKEMNQIEKLDFLIEMGYANLNFYEMLGRLGERMQAFYEKKRTFPHELGIFLGYPIEDVKGFIKNNGGNCLYCGYWKVYANVEEMKSLFQQYDCARKELVDGIIQGCSFCELACIEEADSCYLIQEYLREFRLLS